MKSYQQWSQSELEAEVRKHNRLYFAQGRPEISDEVFDQLVETLRARFPDSAVLAEIGSDLVFTGERASVTHQAAMLSLEKCYDLDLLRAWAEKIGTQFVVMPKIDGVALSLQYDSAGALQVAATRGNGRVGEEVTPNARMIAGIPQQLQIKTGQAFPVDDVEIRGEIYLPLNLFREKFAGDFMSPRNLAAGALKQKDPRKTAEYHVRFLAYDVLGTTATTEVAKREWLEISGFVTVPWSVATCEALSDACKRLMDARDTMDFESDGVVVRLDEVAAQARLGSTAHHPRFAIAYKYAGDAGESVIEAIEWNVARSSVITPVAIVAPVVLSGAQVQRVSLHNYGLAKSHGVGVGARVIVVRRGGVIPYIEKVVHPGEVVLTAPAACPSCGAATRVDDDFVYCDNPNGCRQTRVAMLKHFLDTIECEGFGPKLLEQLVARDLVQDPADLYTLTEAQLRELPRMGEILARKLLAHLAEKKTLPLDLFLSSLGISELARQTSRVLARGKPLEEIFALTEAELTAYHGIGPQIAKAVIQGLIEKRWLIDKLLSVVTVVPMAEANVQSGILSGKRVLFTGTLVRMERKAAQALVEQHGGSNASAVSGELDILVVGDGGGAGSKLKKAEKLVAEGAALHILAEEEFWKRLEIL